MAELLGVTMCVLGLRVVPRKVLVTSVSGEERRQTTVRRSSLRIPKAG
jgi:hypothetical protein